MYNSDSISGYDISGPATFGGEECRPIYLEEALTAPGGVPLDLFATARVRPAIQTRHGIEDAEVLSVDAVQIMDMDGQTYFDFAAKESVSRLLEKIADDLQEDLDSDPQQYDDFVG